MGLQRRSRENLLSCSTWVRSFAQDAGFTGGKDAAGVSVLLGVFKLVMTGGHCQHLLTTAAIAKRAWAANTSMIAA